jgi:hypothetical protein
MPETLEKSSHFQNEQIRGKEMGGNGATRANKKTQTFNVVSLKRERLTPRPTMIRVRNSIALSNSF